MSIAKVMGPGFLGLLLSNPVRHSLKWTVQGLGMLRVYLPCEANLRLHIWHSKIKVDKVSVLHTHPWDFHSHIFAGRLINHTYTTIENREFLHPAGGDLVVLRQMIKCGEGGGLTGDPVRVMLRPAAVDEYGPGSTYVEFGITPHFTEFEDGTITLVNRFPLPDGSPDHAYVYYLESEGWVSAEPRPATKEEVDEYCEAALARLGEVKAR